MGCTCSSSTAPPIPSKKIELTKKNHNHQSNNEKVFLTPKQIQDRTDTPKASLKINNEYIKGTFAWSSFRGYYPNQKLKPNQDSLIISSVFGDHNLSQSFFGVFDGHGIDGHYCSRYVKENLPRNLLNELVLIRYTTEEDEEEIIKDILLNAHLVTNEDMHEDKRFDDTLSGTTSISILIRRNKIYVSNVGDSRALILSVESDEENDLINIGKKELSESLIPISISSAKTEDTSEAIPNSISTDNSENIANHNCNSPQLVPRALSSDQTPYRKDERERIKSTGARVLTIEQVDGYEPIHENWDESVMNDDSEKNGNPPRVWSANHNFPGAAFTRSLGDAFAKSCGVIAAPEFTIQKLTKKDKYLIMASDGVYEFLSNKTICEIVGNNLDPKEACDVIVKEAYNRWTQNENRTDDISIIIIRIDDVKVSDEVEKNEISTSNVNLDWSCLISEQDSSKVQSNIEPNLSNTASSTTKESLNVLEEQNKNTKVDKSDLQTDDLVLSLKDLIDIEQISTSI